MFNLFEAYTYEIVIYIQIIRIRATSLGVLYLNYIIDWSQNEIYRPGGSAYKPKPVSTISKSTHGCKRVLEPHYTCPGMENQLLFFSRTWLAWKSSCRCLVTLPYIR